MSAYDTGKMILFIRSVLWDLNVPQEAATILFKYMLPLCPTTKATHGLLPSDVDRTIHFSHPSRLLPVHALLDGLWIVGG